MKIFLSLTLLLLIAATGSAQGSSFKLADLGFIAGCWQSNQPKQATVGTERWSRLSAGMMMGVSQTVKGDKTVAYEFLRIVQDGTNVFYIARPSTNEGETSFKLIKLANQEATFENPTHDFPQRVIYRVIGQSLFARIEGMNEGKAMGIDFPMVRIKCE